MTKLPPKIVALIKSGQKLINNSRLVTFTKVQFKSHIHIIVNKMFQELSKLKNGFSGDLYSSQDRYDLTSALRSSVVSIDFAGQLRHTDTSLSVKADASYKMPSIGSHKVCADLRGLL